MSQSSLVHMPRYDRGRTPFFHGRTEELAAFQVILVDASHSKGGTIFLVQGPPGAGKSAMLYECTKRAKAAGWRTADIEGNALHDPVALGTRLPAPVRERGGGGIRFGLRGVLELVFHVEDGEEREYREDPTDVVLRQARGTEGVLLVIDEAQNLHAEGQVSTDVTATLIRNLKRIHNGDMGVPVVLLAGGLGTTQAVVKSFGISRFSTGAVHNLGALSEVAAGNMVRDWLVRSGGVPKDHLGLSRWAQILAAEGQNWPQHLHNYAYEAVQWAKAHSGNLTPQVPDIVLAKGRKVREQYYVGRLEEMDRSDRIALANLVRDTGKDAEISRKQIEAALPADRTEEPASQWFDSLLHKGVIAKTDRGGYRVPIPSMHTWLVREYATEEQQQPAHRDRIRTDSILQRNPPDNRVR